jgi:catechol 2,3-dioxygenase-like lactoylglutathione lyase family enzyme
VIEAIANVRFMVDDVDAAVEFYTTKLGFSLTSGAAPASPTSAAARYGCC